MIKSILAAAFILGAGAILWMAAIFIGSDRLALLITLVIGVVYLLGIMELYQYRQATSTLAKALDGLAEPVTDLQQWLKKLAPVLQNPVQLRIEGERVGLPSPVLTPYLVGLLVMLGLLGTFVGMVDTLKGAVVALEGNSELQAIRAGLAAPIQGLGLAFGTSVAGVAASAMLGLISTLSQRERMLETGRLDVQITKVFREFSLVHNRQQTYQALQMQAQLLPDVAEKLASMTDKLEQVGNSLSTNQQQFHQSIETRFGELASSVDQSLKESITQGSRLTADSTDKLEQVGNTLKTNQEQFHQSIGSHFDGLVTSVDQSLKDSVTQSSRLTAESIQPVIKDAMSEITTEIKQSTLSTHQHLSDTAKHQWESLSKDFSQSATSLLERLSAFLEGSQQQASQLQTSNINAQSEQLKQFTELNQATTAAALTEIGTFLESSENLVQARIESEAAWLDSYQQRMEEITSTIKSELSTLNSEEERRGDAAIERLSGLESTVAEHLVNLGKELEAPMTRLIETASETPKAAAEVISQLRLEISNNIERDNQLLEERREIMQQLNTLAGSLQQSSTDQAEVLQLLVESSSETLTELSSKFSDKVDSETSKIAEIVAQFSGSSVEMASLGDAFSLSIQLFNESNGQLMAALNHIEQSLSQANARSDDQLGYYIAQAREIIDHSVLSQKQMLEELKQLGRQEDLFIEEAS